MGRALAGNNRHEALREPPGGAVSDKAKRVPRSEVFDGILRRGRLREKREDGPKETQGKSGRGERKKVCRASADQRREL